MKAKTCVLDVWTEAHQRVTGVLRYKPQDPYAVHFSFRGAGPEGETVLYRFARHLLVEGLDQVAGECDVLVAPHPEDPDWLTITLRPGPGKRTVVYVPSRRVEKFITSTYDMVPMGREHELVDVDKAVDEALAQIFRQVAT
ncbi:SsgA family sporulation/cell division regulator [Nonomuraea sp. NPDC050536]|uniref:SsgA family sporulation/cell division regulator n=1 Tax=Nonomuraea sp. NPDC050536 TaxID=3364366 RepID=UPI0037C52C03